MDTLHTTLVVSSAGYADNVTSKGKKRDLRFFRACLSNIQRSLKRNNEGECLQLSLPDAAYDDSSSSRGDELSGAIEGDSGLFAFNQNNGASLVSEGGQKTVPGEDIVGTEIESNNVAANIGATEGPPKYIEHTKCDMNKSPRTYAASSVEDITAVTIEKHLSFALEISDESHFDNSIVQKVASKSDFNSNLLEQAISPEKKLGFGISPSVSFARATALTSNPAISTNFNPKSADAPSNISTSFALKATLFGGLRQTKLLTSSASTSGTTSSVFTGRNPTQLPISSSSSSGLDTNFNNSVLSIGNDALSHAVVTVTTTIYSGIAVSVKEIHSVPLSDGFTIPRSIKTTGNMKAIATEIQIYL